MPAGHWPKTTSVSQLLNVQQTARQDHQQPNNPPESIRCIQDSITHTDFGLQVDWVGTQDHVKYCMRQGRTPVVAHKHLAPVSDALGWRDGCT